MVVVLIPIEDLLSAGSVARIETGRSLNVYQAGYTDRSTKVVESSSADRP